MAQVINANHGGFLWEFFCGSLVGDFLPLELFITIKKVDVILNSVFLLTGTLPMHQNIGEQRKTVLEYIEQMIMPYVKRIQADITTSAKNFTTATSNVY